MAPYLDADFGAHEAAHGQMHSKASAKAFDFGRVLLIGSMDFAVEEWRELASSVPVQVYKSGDRSDFMNCCRKGLFDGVSLIVRSNQCANLTGRYDDQLLDTLPASVRYITSIGAGVDSLDIRQCESRAIQVSNTPSVGSEAVADMAIFLMLGCLRRATSLLSRVRAGRWQERTSIGMSPRGMTLGLLGMGAIASAFAERALAFGMNVQFCARTKKHIRLMGKDIRQVSQQQLLETSDIVSIHLPLDDTTRSIVSFKEFDAMRQDAVLLNTARGALVNQDALQKALENDKLWAVGLDVLEHEPEVPAWMRKDERVMITPHAATRTKETRRDMEKLCIENINAAIAGTSLPNLVRS